MMQDFALPPDDLLDAAVADGTGKKEGQESPHSPADMANIARREKGRTKVDVGKANVSADMRSFPGVGHANPV